MWDDLRSGDKGALDYIFEHYVSLLQWYGEKITVNNALVEDSIQELFIELWNKKSLLSSTTSIKFYLFKSLRRRIIKKLQREKWHKGILAVRHEAAAEFDISRESSIIEEESHSERTLYIKSLIARLPKRQQEAIYLKFYEDLSPMQIAQVMGLNVPTVYAMIGKAFAVLRKKSA